MAFKILCLEMTDKVFADVGRKQDNTLKRRHGDARAASLKKETEKETEDMKERKERGFIQSLLPWNVDLNMKALCNI